MTSKADIAKLRACSPEHLLKKAMSEEHRGLPVATLLDGEEFMLKSVILAILCGKFSNFALQSLYNRRKIWQR
jgi:hypothetical protein